MKILIAVDGSAYTKRMLAYLAAHQEFFGGRHDYTVIHGVFAVPPYAANFVGPQRVHEYYEAEAEDVLGPIRVFFDQQGLAATFVHPVGQVAESIAGLAEDGRFDLVMMGSRGHGEVLNLVLGSVATRVLARCSVPVLLIR